MRLMTLIGIILSTSLCHAGIEFSEANTRLKDPHEIEILSKFINEKCSADYDYKEMLFEAHMMDTAPRVDDDYSVLVIFLATDRTNSQHQALLWIEGVELDGTYQGRQDYSLTDLEIRKLRGIEQICHP